MKKREKLPLSSSIVQFQYLSWDIRSSGWISGKIRKGGVFFPCHSKRLKPQNLFANPATAVLLLICPFSGLLRWVICSALGCYTVLNMGFVCSLEAPPAVACWFSQVSHSMVCQSRPSAFSTPAAKDFLLLYSFGVAEKVLLKKHGLED